MFDVPTIVFVPSDTPTATATETATATATATNTATPIATATVTATPTETSTPAPLPPLPLPPDLPPNVFPPSIDSVVLDPPNGSTFGNLNPISVTIGAISLVSLRTITFVVDGVPVSSTGYALDVISDTLWNLSWTPPADGVYILHSVAEDWSGALQDVIKPVTITVDARPPTITIASSVLTTAHQLLDNVVPITGGMRATGSFTVELQPGAVPYTGVSVLDATYWRFDWTGTPPPDGLVLPVIARITDQRGLSATASANIVIDLVPPSIFTMISIPSEMARQYPAMTAPPTPALASVRRMWTRESRHSRATRSALSSGHASSTT